MTELIAELVGRRVVILFQGRTEIGTLRGVGDGLLCLDVDAGGKVERVFYAITAITAFRAVENER